MLYVSNVHVQSVEKICTTGVDTQCSMNDPVVSSDAGSCGIYATQMIRH